MTVEDINVEENIEMNVEQEGNFNNINTNDVDSRLQGSYEIFQSERNLNSDRLGRENDELKRKRPGRPKVSLDNASKTTLNRNFRPLDLSIEHSRFRFIIAHINQLVTDTELIDAWHSERLPKDTKTLIGMSYNLIEEEKNFNAKSPVHTAFTKAACKGTI